jgi:hypothetical protein
MKAESNRTDNRKRLVQGWRSVEEAIFTGSGIREPTLDIRKVRLAEIPRLRGRLLRIIAVTIRALRGGCVSGK